MRVVYAVLLLYICNFGIVLASKKHLNLEHNIELLKEINNQLTQIEDEGQTNQLLMQKINNLAEITEQLKQQKGQKGVSKPIQLFANNELLRSRVKLNKERGNQLAVQRDQLRLESQLSNQAIYDYLDYLLLASNNYLSIESIVNHSKKLLHDSLAKQNQWKLPEQGVQGRVYKEVEHSYQQFLQVNSSYQDLLKYIIDNPLRIASIHWTQAFSLISAISYINQFEWLMHINYKLAPFKIDMGGIVLSFIIYFTIYFSYPFVFRFTSWFIERYIIDKGVEHQEVIYHEIRRPARALLIFFGLNLGTHALFYKTDYRESLEGISFIIYCCLFIWLIFKIIDSFVLVQIQHLSRSNIQLRKELFNLGVQSGKFLVVMLFLGIGLSHFGISLAAILSTLGVGGLAFALAAKDTLSNFFGGMTILFDNVFKMGDWVKIGEVEGTVAEIGLRSTTIRTFDNALITIPNSQVSISSVKNWNRRAVGRRIKMYVGVTYESNMDDLRRAVDEIRAMLRDHPEIANPKHKHARKTRGFKFISKEDMQGIKSTQLVFVDRYSDFSIDILIYCFTKSVKWVEWLAIKEDVLYKIADILERNQLEFAYPTQVRIHRTSDDSNQFMMEQMPESD